MFIPDADQVPSGPGAACACDGAAGGGGSFPGRCPGAGGGAGDCAGGTGAGVCVFRFLYNF